MKKYIFVILLALILCPALSHSSSPKENFYNDNLIANAISDVGKMPIEELECFITYLASCNANRGGQIQEFYCDRDAAVYLIKYERGRSIDLMMSVLSIISRWMNTAGKSAAGDPKKEEEINNAILRYVDISLKLKSAANTGFHSKINTR